MHVGLQHQAQYKSKQNFLGYESGRKTQIQQTFHNTKKYHNLYKIMTEAHMFEEQPVSQTCQSDFYGTKSKAAMIFRKKKKHQWKRFNPNSDQCDHKIVVPWRFRRLAMNRQCSLVSCRYQDYHNARFEFHREEARHAQSKSTKRCKCHKNEAERKQEKANRCKNIRRSEKKGIPHQLLHAAILDIEHRWHAISFTHREIG